jgi:hypothetical protein
VAQHSFKEFKHALMSSPLLSPSDYEKDFLLYLASIESTIGMFLFQEDDVLEEYVIYYLSQGLVGSEPNYTHVEKIAL